MRAIALVLTLLAATAAAADEPAATASPAPARSMMVKDGQWTIRHLRRVCSKAKGHHHHESNYGNPMPSPHGRRGVDSSSIDFFKLLDDTDEVPVLPVRATDARKRPPYHHHGGGTGGDDGDGDDDHDDDDEAHGHDHDDDGGDNDNDKDDVTCKWSFGIQTSSRSSKETKCSFRVKGRYRDFHGVRCGRFAVSAGWSGQFGPGNGFTTLSVVDLKKRLIIWPAYRDEQLKGGKKVKPDQSYTPAHLP